MKTLIIIVLSLTFSCEQVAENNDKTEGPGETEIPVSYTTLVDSGWIYFEAKEFSNAVTYFSHAIETDSVKADAYNGIGWSYVQLDRFPLALTSFSKGKLREPLNADYDAGTALVHYTQTMYASSNTAILAVIDIDDQWEFAHGLNYSINDLYVVSAHNYFLLGVFESSLEMVQHLDPLFSADITNYEGKKALAEKIESYNKHSF